MLTQLNIKNVAIIDEIEIAFGPGLNILTGETGAGKSIVIDSITALIGGRLSKDIIRTGAEKAIFEGLFIINDQEKLNQLSEVGFEVEEDNSLLVVREFYQNGKNICKVNGHLVTVSMLKELGKILIDIHGQHENQSLLDQTAHVGFLDSFIGQDFQNIKQEYGLKFSEFKNLQKELATLMENPEERARKIDLLNFQINEITSADLKPGEEEALIQKKKQLENAEMVANSLSNAYEILSGEGTKKISVLSGLFQVIKELNQISFVDEKYLKIASVLDEIFYEIQEISRDIRSWMDGIEYNPELLDRIDERLDLIARLKRKYGKDIQTILEYCNSLKAEFENLINSEERINQLNSKIKLITHEMIKICKEMSNKRSETGKQLELIIEKELKDLEMKNMKFIVQVEFMNWEKQGEIPRFTENGLDKVEFLISPNIGEPPKPLEKIASGGEMSRIMLAIKTILAKVDKKSTLVFDEIDTGISGKTIQAIAEKLAYISLNHQVICVTHHAHIAAMADIHFDIEKVVEGGRTVTKVIKIEDEEQDKILARILGGAEVSNISLQHAREIKRNAQRFKNNLVQFGK